MTDAAEATGDDGCCGGDPVALDATGERPADGDDDSAGTRNEACNAAEVEWIRTTN